jgi:hypothetical protein
MKRTLIAAALALPFVAQAAPVASFNDHAELYTKPQAVQSSGIAGPARVAPSFNDNAPIAGMSEVANTVVLAKADFHYPAF